MSSTLTLNLEKPGVPAPKSLKLSLQKGAVFTATIFWDCHPAHKDDLDVHAFEAVNNGSGAKVWGLAGVLSTYNTKKMSRLGALPVNADGSFATPSGGLTHSVDVRIQGSSEVITIDGSKLPAGVNEVPLIATVHEADHGAGHEGGHEGEEEAAFADIEICTVTIADQRGTVLGSYTLSKEFGEFNVVQLGSIMYGDEGWVYVPVGRGFTGDLNDVLAHFS